MYTDSSNYDEFALLVEVGSSLGLWIGLSALGRHYYLFIHELFLKESQFIFKQIMNRDMNIFKEFLISCTYSKYLLTILISQIRCIGYCYQECCLGKKEDQVLLDFFL